MGSCHADTGKFRGHIGIVPGPPEGFRGSIGRVHLPRRALWAVGRREPAPSGLGAIPPRAHAPRFWGDPKGGGRPLALGGKATLLAAARSPLPLYICGGWEGSRTLAPGAALPSPKSFSSPVGAWRSPAGLPRSSFTTMPWCCYWMESSPTSPSLLAGSRHGRRHRAVRVLNAEVPSVRHLIIGDLNHDEYDSINPVHLNASA